MGLFTHLDVHAGRDVLRDGFLRLPGLPGFLWRENKGVLSQGSAPFTVRLSRFVCVWFFLGPSWRRALVTTRVP